MRSERSERDNDVVSTVAAAVVVVVVATALPLDVDAAASAAVVEACSSFGNTGTGVPIGIPSGVAVRYIAREVMLSPYMLYKGSSFIQWF